MQSETAGATLTLSTEPVLFLYRDKNEGLARELGTADVWLTAAPEVVRGGETSVFSLSGPGLRAESLRISGPPLWKTTLKQVGEDRVDVTFVVPDLTSARVARFFVQLVSGAHASGELTVSVRVQSSR